MNEIENQSIDQLTSEIVLLKHKTSQSISLTRKMVVENE